MEKSSPLARLIAETTKKSSPADKLKVSLFKSLRESNPPRKPKVDMFSPSSMNKCEREIYYRIHATQPDPDLRPPSLAGRINSILQNGNDRHERLQERMAALKEEGHDIEWVDVAQYVKERPELGTIEIPPVLGDFGEEDIENPTEKELKKLARKQKEYAEGYETKLYNEEIAARFLCDGVLKMDGKYYIAEIKTMNMRKWGTCLKAQKPLADHLEQAACYSIALGIDDIIYIYENRDSLDLLLFSHRVTAYQKEELIKKIRRVQKYKELQKLPPQTLDVKTKCTYCDYKSRCTNSGLTRPLFGEWDNIKLG